MRLVFQASFGELAQEMAASLRRVPANGQQGLRVLTDLSGPFDTVVSETGLDSLAAWEQGRVAMFADPDFQASAASSNDLIVSGRQEFYTIAAAY